MKVLDRLLALLLFAGCARFEAIDPPPTALPPDGVPALSLIMVDVRAGAIERVEAIDLQHPRYPSVSYSARDPVGVYALLYAATLDAMRVTPGPQTVVSASDPGSFLLSGAAAMSQGGATLGPLGDIWAIDLPAIARWTEVVPTALPTSVYDLKIDVVPEASCVELDIKTFPTDSRYDGSMAVAIDAHNVLAATTDGHFFRATTSSAVRLTAVATTTPHLAGFTSASGEIWLLGHNGTVARGRPETGFTVVGHTASQTGVTWAFLDGPRDASPFELYAVTDQQVLEHYDGRSWQILAQDPRPNDNAPWAAGVAWIAPGEALALGPKINTLLHHHGGVLDEEPLPIASDDFATTVAFIPRLGVVVGTDRGKLYQPQGSEWREIVGAHSNGSVRLIVALDEGLLYGGTDGDLEQYRPAIGFCPQQGYAPFHIHDLVPLEDGYLLTAQSTKETVISPLIVLSRKKAP
jgi:hypothetical protein